LSAFVDTNVLVRHLTGDPAPMAAKATAFLRQEEELLLTDVVVAETVYVLESFYESPREQVAQAIQALLAMPSVVAIDGALLRRATEVYEVDRLDFAEAYLVACAESTGVNRIASFDQSIDRVGTVGRVEPLGSERPR
jgi:predicted nucleic acid-binding protein